METPVLLVLDYEFEDDFFGRTIQAKSSASSRIAIEKAPPACCLAELFLLGNCTTDITACRIYSVRTGVRKILPSTKLTMKTQLRMQTTANA